MNQADLSGTNSPRRIEFATDARLPVPAPEEESQAPLTGRDTEVSLLYDRWEQAQEGMGQVVSLVGDAGMGKSRLVDTIKARVMQDNARTAEQDQKKPTLTIIEWRAWQRYQDTSLHPIADYLRRSFRFTREENTAEQFDRLAHYLERHGLDRPDLVALFAKLLFLPPDERYPAPGLSPEREREETFRALRAWLRACSRRHPVLFIVEDLHWIDASTLEFLEQFILEGLHDRILTILTFRPQFRMPWTAPAHQTSLALNRLTRRQVAELMRRDIGSALPDSIVGQVYQRTTGVPLLVEEFTSMIRESALIEKSKETEIPATLQQLVMTRLNGMAGSHEVAQLAATLGREFRYEILAALVRLDETELKAELTKLAAAKILFAKGQPPDCTYRFKHALLEEALHSGLELTQRQNLHRQVAEVMESRFNQSAELQPELLAQHFTEAGMIQKAVSYWLQAGQRSHAQFANVEAISHLNKGLELLTMLEESPDRDARELELLGLLSTAYIAARGYAAPEVKPVVHRARLLAERLGQTPQAFAMMRGHFAYHIVRGDFRHCTDLADEAVQFAESLSDPGILMEALFLQGLTMLYRGDFAGAHECCTRALASYDDRERTAFWAARTGENSGVAHRCYLALATWHLGFPDRAIAINHEAQELARTLDHPFSLEYALHHTAWLRQHLRLGAKTQAAGDEESRIASEQGFVFWQASGAIYSAAGLILRGHLEEGLPMFEQGLAEYRATGAGLGLPYYLSILGDAYTRAGRYEAARHTLEEALHLVEKNDERFPEAELYRLRGELYLAEAKDEVNAEESYRTCLEIARRHGSRAWELRGAVSLARLRRQQGRGHEGYTVLAAVLGNYSEGFSTPDLIDAENMMAEMRNERMRDEIDAGMKYVRGVIPAPMVGPVSVDWRYVPSSTLGGDTIGYHWVDSNHLAFYLIDVTGHGLDSALLAVTITNVIRSGSLSGGDARHPDQVLAALNRAFQGAQHGYKFFTIWYGVYQASTRTLTYASGGHPAAVILNPGGAPPVLMPATGPLVGVVSKAQYTAASVTVPSGARLLVFSDGVFEIRRDKQLIWNQAACIAHLVQLGIQTENTMDALFSHIRTLHGSPQLDDDFSIIEARFA